ncbi:hypothetical protein RIR_e48021_A0A2I1FAQ6_9GLOM [Rhizophagus irregularis DAOM 181602=DAOM 197198]|nr:hypothetical protein RhiirB3_91149 [Rhizophagus irregularis]GET57511.1 hypothetical protein RIR_e48021_A0A2I1FAQ6_9GLOM [Rhizophagus irregularis DAOM 181602=DAOM 197198]
MLHYIIIFQLFQTRMCILFYGYPPFLPFSKSSILYISNDKTYQILLMGFFLFNTYSVLHL